MAVDTAEKRMQVAGCGLPWMALPLAQGTIDAQERAGIAALYGGNAFAGPVASSDVGIEFTVPHDRGHFVLKEDRAHFAMNPDRMHFTLFDEDA